MRAQSKSQRVFLITQQIDSKISIKMQRANYSQDAFEEEKQGERRKLALLDVRMYCKAPIIETMCNWGKISQTTGTE